MAHFAKLDENNVVTEVHVVNNIELLAADGSESELLGVAFLTRWSGGYSNWKQTSYNGRIRKNYAGIGYTYDQNRDAFIPPQPFPSWTLNEDTCLWEPPIAYPNDGKIYYWVEDKQVWETGTPVVKYE
jgi:hypothetical protein